MKNQQFPAALNPAPARSGIKPKPMVILILGVLLFSLVKAATAFCDVIHIGISPQAVPRGNYMQLADIWLNAQLQAHVRTSASSFLAEIPPPEDLSKAGMQVFFHQTDAAVIPKDTLDMIDAILELHLSPIGQQILHLFKTDRIIAYQPKDMDTVRAVGEILSGTHP